MTNHDKNRTLPQDAKGSKPIPAPSPEQQETTKENAQRPQEFHHDSTSPDPSITERDGNSSYGVNSSKQENLRN